MRLVSAVAVLLRRLRAERSVALLLFTLVAVTAFAVAAGPRLFNRVADDGLRYEVERATAIQRNLQLTRVDLLPATPDDPLARVVAGGAILRGQLPDSVVALVEEERYVIDSTRFLVADPPRYRTYLTFRQQDGLDGQVDLVEGRWPEAVAPAPPDGTGEPSPPRFEVAISERTAEATGVAVGDRLAANVDPGDPMLRNVFPRPTTAIDIDVVGRFGVRDPGTAFWYDDGSLDEITVGGTDDNPIAFATGLFAPEAYADLVALGLPARYRWREFVDASRLDASGVDRLSADLRRVEAAFTTAGVTRAGATLLRTGLPDVIDRYLDQRATSEAALSVAALGPLAVAAGAVGLVGVLVIRRRRPALALARGRGASAGQLLAAQLWEGLLLTVPAALLGLGAAVVLVVARATALSSVGAMLVALAATALLIASTWPIARRARRELERDDPPTFRLSPRRLVFESLVVGLSLAAAWLLRERGLDGAGEAAGGTGFDPFLAASPVLIGLAVGLLTIRLYPIPVRALGWVMARRRDLVPVLGLRNLGRHPTTGYLPLLILMLTVAIGTFSSVLQASIERSQSEVAWQDIGADYRIETSTGGSLAGGLDVRQVPGVDAVAEGRIVPNAPLSVAPGRRFTMLVEAIDPAAYAAVLAGAPVTPALPASFATPPVGPGAGTDASPIPAVVSDRRPNGSDPLTLGEAFELTLDGQTFTFRVDQFSPTFPGIGRSDPFVVVPFDAVRTAWQGPLRPNVLFVRAPADAGAGLSAALDDQAGAAAATSRYERFAAMHDAPLVAAVVGGFAIALLVAGAYAALAVIAVVVLHAQRRARELAFLRTLGLTSRQVAALTIVEQGLPVVLALAIGVALGLVLAWLLAPGIDLAAFSSREVTVFLQVDWASVAGVAAAVVTVVAIAIAASTWLAGRLDLGQALRIGEE